MRKNIWVLLAFSAAGFLTLTSCSKKSVVPPKQTEKSAANLSKPGSTTTTTQNQGSGSCGSNGYYNGANGPGATSPGS